MVSRRERNLAKPLPLAERAATAARMALKAKQHFMLWRLTHGTDGHRQHRPVFSEYWEAIRFLQNGQFIAAIVELHSLCERRSDTINLAALADEVEAIGADVSTRSQLIEAEGSVAKIRLLRNAAIAHRTSKRSYNDVFMAADITPNEIERLIEITIQVSGDLSDAVGNQREELNPYPLETYHRLVRDLRAVVGD
jgi:hypothetical protein